MVKKITGIFLIVLLVAVTLIGCASKQTEKATDSGNASVAPTDGKNAKDDAKGVIQVKFAVWGSGASENYRRVQEDFNSKHPNIKLTIEMEGNYWDYMGAKTASNDLPDLFYLAAFDNVHTYAKNNMLADLSDRPFAEKLYPSMKPPVSYENKIYGYPFGMSFIGVLYNKDLFAKAGITELPKTVSQFKEVTKKLKDAGITPWTSALKDDWTIGHLVSNTFGAMLKDNQEQWVEEMNKGTGSYGGAASDKVFEVYDIIRDNMNPNPLDSDVNNANKLFATGQTAMFHNGDWAIGDITKINPNIKIGLFPLPVTENPDDAVLSVDAQGVVCVNKNSKHMQETLEVFDALTDTSSETGYIAEMTKIGVTPPMDYSLKVNLNEAEEPFKNALRSGKTVGWLFQKYPSISIHDQVGKIIQGYFAGAKTKEQSIKEMDQAWKKALK